MFQVYYSGMHAAQGGSLKTTAYFAKAEQANTSLFVANFYFFKAKLINNYINKHKIQMFLQKK